MGGHQADVAEQGARHHLLQPFRPVAKGRSMGRIMHALAAAHDAAVQIIDTSIVRVHQRAATRYDKLAANERLAASRPLQGGPHLDQSGSQRRAERAAGAGTARAKGEEDGRTGFDTRRGQRWERGARGIK